jgi:DNA-directed RNA polymerase specialized sigma24 family protein
MDVTPYTDFIKKTCKRLAYPYHDDIIQDVTIKLLTAEPQHENIKGYIYCTCRTVYIDHLRKRKYTLPEKTYPTSCSLLDRDLRSEVRKLPRHLRRLIWLVAMGCSYIELARYTRKPIGTVKSELHIARKMIKARL